MAEPKDPAIKLFGKTIPVPEISPGVASSSCFDDSNAVAASASASASTSVDGVKANETGAMDQDRPCVASYPEESEFARLTMDGEESNLIMEEGKPEVEMGNKDNNENEDDSFSPDATSGNSETSEASPVDKEKLAKASIGGEQQNETNSSTEKTLKKPEKILPCPRCNSMDTKFCYYNNYNVNQPRHFCKNCQRYWTAGGTMRNVPVGAGRRKNKNSASHYRHIAVSESLQNVRADGSKAIHPSLKANGTVLTFGSDIPLHESMASVLTIADKSMRNAFLKLDPMAVPVSCDGVADHSTGSSGAESCSKDETARGTSTETVMQNIPTFVPRLPCFPGAPWPYHLNQAQWNTHLTTPAFVPPGFAVPIFPAPPYWGCTMAATPWNVPWMASPVSPQSVGSSGPISPTLGKHSRDDNNQKLVDQEGDETMKDCSTERSLWIPKTLRIDDPEEAAKSSIWTTLGIKNDKPDLIGNRALFRSFESKGNEKKHATETSPVLQANPAALSRSVNFHESS